MYINKFDEVVTRWLKTKLHLVLKILRSVFGLTLYHKKQGNRIHTLQLSGVCACKKKITSILVIWMSVLIFKATEHLEFFNFWH